MSRTPHEPGRRAPVAQVKAPLAELDAAKASARAAGLSLSAWTRALWKGGPVSSVPEDEPPWVTREMPEDAVPVGETKRTG